MSKHLERATAHYESRFLRCGEDYAWESIEVLADLLAEVENEALERVAKFAESMVIGGRQWTEEQAAAASALFALADHARALKEPK